MADLPTGANFLFEKVNPETVFTPEDFSDEHKMIYRTSLGFITDNILSRVADMEAKKEGLNKKLLLEAGELGLLGTDCPEQYGGYEMDKISTCIICECMGWAGGFAMTHGAQTGVGQLPILYFGTEEQRIKYLPKIVSGEIVTAYALTEAGAGTDALAAKVWAQLSPDGKHYIINGTKQFITNAPIADLFILFAKIDRQKFTGFIVEKGTEGVSTGPEEHKMGIKSSNTTTLIFEDAKIPVENVLYEIGKGHVIAFNILNIGRFKTASTAVGMSKYALELSTTYANERIQFNQPISKFGLIKEKLAEMAIKTFVGESMIYRTAGLLEDILHSLDISGPDRGQIAAKGLEEYAVECSINKVFTTEAQGDVVDEGVQIHGGYGFTSDYTIEQLYRDCRIYRIFEGTNEINRVVITSTIIRRGLKGEIPLQDALDKVEAQMISGFPVREGEGDLIQAAKDIYLMTLGLGLKKYGEGLLQYQEIVGKLADIAIIIFGMESAWLRVEKALAAKGEADANLKHKMASVFINSNIEIIHSKAKEIIVTLADEEELTGLLNSLNQMCQYRPVKTVALRQEIAEAIAAAGKYVV